MTARFARGERVLVVHPDHPGHCRSPRYVQGRSGVVVADHGPAPLPDAGAAGVRPVPTHHVYAVRFDAHQLFGSGSHAVTVDLWEPYLTASQSMVHQ